jgi:hypothetical protein
MHASFRVSKFGIKLLWDHAIRHSLWCIYFFPALVLYTLSPLLPRNERLQTKLYFCAYLIAVFATISLRLVSVAQYNQQILERLHGPPPAQSKSQKYFHKILCMIIYGICMPIDQLIFWTTPGVLAALSVTLDDSRLFVRSSKPTGNTHNDICADRGAPMKRRHSIGGEEPLEIEPEKKIN